MKKLSFLFVFLFVFVCVSDIFAQDKKSFDGTLVKKGWTKTTQSYCAGGSDYFVLQMRKEEIILVFEDKDLPAAKALDGKKVQLVAIATEKTIKADPMSQQPVQMKMDANGNFVKDDGGYNCTVYKVVSFTKL